MNDIDLAISNLICKHKTALTELENLQQSLASVQQTETAEVNNLTFTRQSFGVFEQFYAKAVTGGKDSFLYNDVLILTSYAKYIIEFLNIKFNKETAK